MELSQNCNAEAQKIIATQTGNQTFYDLMASLEPSKSIIFNITGNDRENLQTKFPLVFTERRHLEFFDLPIVNGMNHPSSNTMLAGTIAKSAHIGRFEFRAL